MNDEIWQRDEPNSPCVNICQIHPVAKICIGCFRTMDEIASWPRMDTSTRLALKGLLLARAEQVKPKRRGGARRNQQNRPRGNPES